MSEGKTSRRLGMTLAFLSTIATGWIGVPVPARAFLFCSEPSEPYCVEGSGYFDDQNEFQRCKSDVERYVSDVEDYTQCLTDEHNEAIEKANEAVEKFNCRAEGRSYC